jgi:hypothetical protein
VSVTFEAGERLARDFGRAPSPKPDAVPTACLSGRRGEIVAGRLLGAKRRRIAWRLWLGIGLVMAATLFVLAKPRAVIRVLPRLSGLYAAAGMPVNLRGFAFEHVTARFEEAGGARFLAVEGVLRNVARAAGDAPRLRLTLSDAAGRKVYAWTASTGVRALGPGEAAPFRARLAAPPPEAQRVMVDFVADAAAK